MAEPIRIAIVLEGGLVQQVLTAGIAVECVIVDLDTEGADQSDLSQTNEGEAYLSWWTGDDSAAARETVAQVHRMARTLA